MTQQILSETKAQRWRALAVLTSGSEALLCLGQSIVQVREYYLEPWYDMFTEEVRRDTDEIQIQKWIGAASCGEWKMQATLPVPPVRRAVA